MLIFVQMFTVLLVVAGTFLVFKALGQRGSNLLYTKKEREQWVGEVGPKVLPWFTITNIVGTLTSLATVWLFFIGSSKLFGPWVFVCSLFMLLSAWVTNAFTTKIMNSDYMKGVINSEDQTGGVIAKVFWRSTREGRQTAVLVKWISLFSITAIIWLEFSVFSDISGRLLGFNTLWFKVPFLILSSFAVIYFTLRYALRGFIFADIFQAPLMALCAVILLMGCAILLFNHSIPSGSVGDFFKPIVPRQQCMIFVMHDFFLASFYVLVSEGHWIRLWIFRENESKQQGWSQLAVAILWGMLILVGFFASAISGLNAFGEDAVVGLLGKLTSVSWIFPSAFWAGGTAALFSAADAQIFSFMLVKSFVPSSGNLKGTETSKLKPVRYALLGSVVFAIVYAVLRYFAFPFEKIIFIVIPMTLNLLPAFVLAARGKRQNHLFLWLSLVLYAAASIRGLQQPTSELMWTLCASLAPVGVSILAFLTTLGEKNNETSYDNVTAKT